jgi:S-(hydroxymethyl)glutathione dehydrogenase/alcohol dehydrogenase
MRAVILKAYGERPAVKEVKLLDPGPDQVRVKVGASGVCHSDYSAVTGVYQWALPVIVGHEYAGTILEVGSQVRGLAPGDRVVCTFTPACGQCWQCLHEGSHLCESAPQIGTSPRALRPTRETTAKRNRCLGCASVVAGR